MVKKIASMILMAVAAVTIASCYDPLFGDYYCSGLGTCDSLKACSDGYDSYYVADGETFYCNGNDCAAAAADLNNWCGGSNDYVCDGAGTCSSPETCCDAYDCYYYADGVTFDCNGTDCYSAADDLNYYCGY